MLCHFFDQLLETPAAAVKSFKIVCLYLLPFHHTNMKATSLLLFPETLTLY